MSYITRNEAGKIDQWFAFLPDPAPETYEEIDSQASELLVFLDRSVNGFPLIKPKWLEFNQAMLTNETYNRLVTTGNMLMVSRLETMSISGNENWGMYKFFWDAIAKDQNVTPEEVVTLNDIAAFCQMPFSFAANLEMLLT
jgi:hypothetical protein